PLEVRRALAAVAVPARRDLVLAGQVEAGLRVVVERGRLPHRGRVAGAAGRRGAERLEPIAVPVVLGVALLARADRLALAERLGVAVVALELGVRAEAEPRPLGVIEERHLGRV